MFTVTRSRSLRAALLLSSLFALAGCGGAATTTAPASGPAQAQKTPDGSNAAGVTAATGQPDACKLVTPEEAATVLGVAVGAAQGVKTTCNYPPATGSMPSLTITAGRYPDAATLKAGFDKARAAQTSAADIPGLGDGAYTAGDGHGVTFIKGTVVVSLILVSPGSGAAYKDRMIAAARSAARRV